MSLNLNSSKEQLQKAIDDEEKKTLRGAKIGCVVIIVLLLSGISFLAYKIISYRGQGPRTERTQGCLTTVTTYWNITMGSGYTIEYEFKVGEQNYTGSGALDEYPGQPERPCTPIVVMYESGNPGNNQVENDLGPWGPLASKRIWLWFITACVVIFLLSVLKDAVWKRLKKL